jgi:hypothetical protein
MSAPDGAVVLRAEGISKAWSTPVLDRVSLDLRGGDDPHVAGADDQVGPCRRGERQVHRGAVEAAPGLHVLPERGRELTRRRVHQVAEVAADPQLIPDLVEEALRYVSPVQYTFRTALAPIELPGGEVLEESETIILMIVGANRDPQIFDEPNRFDIHRHNARKHLAFGFGIHHCLGAALARMEAEITWRHLLARFPDPQAWSLAGEPVANPSRMIHGLRSLPVQVERRVRA